MLKSYVNLLFVLLAFFPCIASIEMNNSPDYASPTLRLQQHKKETKIPFLPILHSAQVQLTQLAQKTQKLGRRRSLSNVQRRNMILSRILRIKRIRPKESKNTLVLLDPLSRPLSGRPSGIDHGRRREIILTTLIVVIVVVVVVVIAINIIINKNSLPGSLIGGTQPGGQPCRDEVYIGVQGMAR